VKILLVDDEAKIRDVVKAYLEAEGFQVLEAENGAQALKLFDEEQVDLLVLDLMLPDISGEEVCRRLRQFSRVPIIMLTAKVAEDDLLKGLDIGADDYVTKPFSPRQLMARIKALLRRTEADRSVLADTLQSGDLCVDFSKHQAVLGGSVVNITPSEFNILSLLIRNPQKVFTREELIELSFGDDYEGFDRVVDTHIKNLRQKIEADPKNPIFIKTVHGIGYTFGGEKESK